MKITFERGASATTLATVLTLTMILLCTSGRCTCRQSHNATILAINDFRLAAEIEVEGKKCYERVCYLETVLDDLLADVPFKDRSCAVEAITATKVKEFHVDHMNAKEMTKKMVELVVEDTYLMFNVTCIE